MSNVTLMLSTSSTAVILGAVAGNEQVGYFSAADKVIRAASSMLNPVSQALYPHLAALNEESPARALQLVRKSFWLITSIAFAVSVGAFFFSGPVSRAVFGHQFRASVPVLHWLSFLPVLFALMSILGTQTMMVFHLDALLSRIVLQCSVAGLLLVAVLSWLFGAVGAAVGSVATIMAIVAYMASALRKRNLAVWRNGTR